MFNSILVPLDGTAESNIALPVARTLARVAGGTITLVRACAAGEDKQHVQTELARIAEELAAADLAVHAEVGSREPVEEILAQATAHNADLIVMRTHGRSGVGRMILGSVAQRVLTRSQVPVVLARPGGRRLNQVRHVLVPVDGSPGGAFALGTAVELARSAGAALHLLDVVVTTSSYVYAAGAWADAAYLDPEWDDEALASAKTYVDGLCARIASRVQNVTGEAVIGTAVAETIVERATQQDVDLIVMSSHTLTGVARAILGSVSDAVVRTADCPVLVLHAIDQPVGLDSAPLDGSAVAEAALPATAARP